MIINMNLKTNNMKYIKIISEEIIFSHENDRHILIRKAPDGKIIGLNFCQGNDYDYFAEHYSGIDRDLTRFYQEVSGFINLDNEYDLINEVIWAWFRYKNEY